MAPPAVYDYHNAMAIDEGAGACCWPAGDAADAWGGGGSAAPSLAAHKEAAASAPAPSFRERLLAAVARDRLLARFGGDVAALLVWLPIGPPHATTQQTAGQRYAIDEAGAVTADPTFAAFCAAAVQAGPLSARSMVGRAFATGRVELVQRLSALPSALHPRCRLSSDAAARVGEVMWLPVFDAQAAGPYEARGRVAAVVEALLSARAHDAMAVASLGSWLSASLAERGLCVTSPVPQPVLPSPLAGRHARPLREPTPSSSDEDDGDGDDDAKRGGWVQRPAASKVHVMAACGADAWTPAAARAAAAAASCSADSAATAAAAAELGSCGAFAAGGASGATLHAPPSSKRARVVAELHPFMAGGGGGLRRTHSHLRGLNAAVAP